MAELTPLQRMLTPRTVPEIEEYKDSLERVLRQILIKLDTLSRLTEEIKAGSEENVIPICLRRNIFCRFKVDLLPSLRDRLTSICALLDRFKLLNNDQISTLRMMLEDLVQVDEIVTELWRCITPVVEIIRKSKELPSEPTQVVNNDNLCTGPLESLNVLWEPITIHFEWMIEPLQNEFHLLQHLLRNSISANGFVDELEPKWNWDSPASINGIIEKLNRSDFQIYRDEYWRCMVAMQSSQLLEAIQIIREKSAREPTNLLLIESMNAFVPIMKLIRLFFNKMCKLTNSQVHPASQMDTVLLTKFNEIICQTFYDVPFIFEAIARPPNHTRNPATILNGCVTTIIKKAIKLLNEFFCSPSNAHILAVQDNHNWYLTWAGQFDVGMNQFLARYINLHHQQYPRFFLGQIES